MRKRILKSFLMGNLIIGLLFSVFSKIAYASSPYERNYDAPVDSIVVWFHDYCNQHQQARAFFHIVKFKDWYKLPYNMVEIKQEYDVQAVRDAFEFFVRSITVDRQQEYCAEFHPDYWLGGSSDDTKPEEWEGWAITGPVLSLFINLGFTQDLYEIADRIYFNGVNSYFAYLWNRLGVGYFQHLETKLSYDASFFNAIRMARFYLTGYETPPPQMRNEALDILHYGATALDVNLRYITTSHLVPVYLTGYVQIKTDIDLLLNDQSDKVRKSIRGQIRGRQIIQKKMMNFLTDE